MKQFLLIFLMGLFFCAPGNAQHTDSAQIVKDTAQVLQPDTTRRIADTLQAAIPIAQQPASALQNLLKKNIYLNSKATPVSLAVSPRKVKQQNSIFYVLASIIFFFGILRTVYNRYFSTLFRVFFNTTLRQSQLTDQLLQSKLPSLFFNLLFIITGGAYVYLLLNGLNSSDEHLNWGLLGASIGILLLVYLVKYFSVKFTGWVTGFKEEANSYVFIVFLINKIIGICMLPVIVLLAFSPLYIVDVVVLISYVLIGILILMRFYRAFGLLQHKLKVSRFHFLLYIFSLEILPLMLIYKSVEFFIVKML